MGYESSWLLSQRRINGDSFGCVGRERRFRYRIHATAPTLESSYATEVEDTTDWNLPL